MPLVITMYKCIYILSIFFSFTLFNANAQTKKSVTLIVGLKKIDEKAYKKLYGKSYDKDGLSGADNDCNVMNTIASSSNDEIVTLRDEKATASNILKNLDSIGKIIKASGENAFFTFYYSGHGDTIKDRNHDEPIDQVLVAYDNYVIDDQIDSMLKLYYTKSKNLMIVDACHSGSTYKIFLTMDFLQTRLSENFLSNNTKATFHQNLSVCDFKPIPTKSSYNLIYLGATPDDKSAIGGLFGSLLTSALESVRRQALATGQWNQMTYRSFACRLATIMQSRQQNLVYVELGDDVGKYSTSVPFKK